MACTPTFIGAEFLNLVASAALLVKLLVMSLIASFLAFWISRSIPRPLAAIAEPYISNMYATPSAMPEISSLNPSVVPCCSK